MRRAVLRNQDVNAAEPSHDRQTTQAPARLPLTINFACRAYWTLEQALTAFELLDDLRDQIGAHYSGQPFELGRVDTYGPALTISWLKAVPGKACIVHWQAWEISRVLSKCHPVANGIDLSLLEPQPHRVG